MSVQKVGIMCSDCDPKAKKRRKTKEDQVAKALTEAGITYQREVHIGYSCSELETDNKKNARIDFLIERPTHRILLENDENQHKDRIMSCEVARMAWVMEAIQAGQNTRPTLWIRFNPDSFKINGQNQKIPKKERFHQLCQEICKERPNLKDGFRILYMYYDLDDNLELKILEDDDYPEWFKPMIL